MSIERNGGNERALQNGGDKGYCFVSGFLLGDY